MAPHDFPADYYNRTNYYSVLMQGMVDHLYRFTDVYIGWPGWVHDARVFGNSKLYERVENGTLFPNRNPNCDPAYPLLTWLMKPHQDNSNRSPNKCL